MMYEEESCPLCMEQLDPDDQAFFPCPCKYQVCLFCVHRIQENCNGQCPACRRCYDESSYAFDEEIKEAAVRRLKEKKEHEKSAKKSKKKPATVTDAKGSSPVNDAQKNQQADLNITQGKLDSAMKSQHEILNSLNVVVVDEASVQGIRADWDLYIHSTPINSSDPLCRPVFKGEEKSLPPLTISMLVTYPYLVKYIPWA